MPSPALNRAPLLEVSGVSMRFARRPTLGERVAARVGAGRLPGVLHAVSDASVHIDRGETLGLVGESGCGKTTLGRIVAGILSPTAGTVRLDGGPVRAGGRKRTTRVQTVFQDPFASLNPRRRVGEQVGEGPVAHGLAEAAGAARYVGGWLARVGLDPAYAERFPHQLSGGQRQRVAIARALAMRPDLLVCDEPVASLDVSIQAQIVNLLLDLRAELGLTCLFISHDLGVVRHLSDRVAVMYLGRIVESGPTAAIYERPAHPYTRALLASVPRIARGEGAARHAFRPVEGELPSPLAPPPGCPFHPRCPDAIDRCRTARPEFRIVEDSQGAACHLAGTPVA
ncbi:MAG: ABC transporter ATP-binding protein [Alphaproteobacteria bacterium]